MINEIFFFFYNFSNKNIFLDKIIFFCAEYLPVVLFSSALVIVFIGVYRTKHKHLNIFSLSWHFIRSIFGLYFPAFISFLISTLIKKSFEIPRPEFYFQPGVIEPLFKALGPMDSMPSGHATFFISLGVTFYILNKKLGIIFIIGALIISLARVSSGVHFFVDVVVGLIIGITIPLIFKKTIKKYKEILV